MEFSYSTTRNKKSWSNKKMKFFSSSKKFIGDELMNPWDMDNLLKNIPYLIKDNENAMLIVTIMMEEVKKVIFQIHLDKAPRPNGYPTPF